MGHFSWITKEGEPIYHKDSDEDLFTVYMHAPDGRRWEEKNYAGLGIFGGKDYWQLLAELNGYPSELDCRIIGMMIFYKDCSNPGELDPPLLDELKKRRDLITYPILTTKANWKGDFTISNEEDPKQGFGPLYDGPDTW